MAGASGSDVWTADGRRLIDFTSGWNTTNLGWNHPEVAEAMAAQAHRNSYSAMWTSDPVQEAYAEALIQSLPSSLCVVGRATGGTEANEMAIKAARAYTGRKIVVGCRETYHGQSTGTLQIGFPDSHIADVVTPGAEYVQLPYPDCYRIEETPERVLPQFAERLEQTLATRQVAAVVTEAGIVTGWGSTVVAPKGYLALVRRLTERYGTVMILDEVGTGFSRCGRLFGLELDGVVPDVVTMAKGITNGGAAMGAVVMREDLAEVACAKSLFISTFGWTPVACAAALKTLEIHRRDRVWEKAERDGAYIVARLREALGEHPHVGDIRGIGLEIGLDIVADRATKAKDPQRVVRIMQEGFVRGVHLTGDQQSTIQLMPPLTIDRVQLDDGLNRLIEAVRAVGAC
jgi:4-aminobutyrate aminotransferase